MAQHTLTSRSPKAQAHLLFPGTQSQQHFVSRGTRLCCGHGLVRFVSTSESESTLIQTNEWVNENKRSSYGAPGDCWHYHVLQCTQHSHMLIVGVCNVKGTNRLSHQDNRYAMPCGVTIGKEGCWGFLQLKQKLFKSGSCSILLLFILVILIDSKWVNSKHALLSPSISLLSCGLIKLSKSKEDSNQRFPTSRYFCTL